MQSSTRGLILFAIVLLLLPAPGMHRQCRPPPRQEIILDTDIGDNIDDAFALALALSCPEFAILGVITAVVILNAVE